MWHVREMAVAAALLCGITVPPLDAQQSAEGQNVSSQAPTDRLVDCALAPFTSQKPCEVTLPPGQDSLPFSVRVKLTHTPAALSDTRVTIGSSRCCVQPQVATVDPNGFVSVTWRANQRSDLPVTVGFAVMDGRDLRQDSVIIRPTSTPEKQLERLTLAADDHAYVWVRGDRVPRLIPVRIQSVGSTRLNRETCESVKVRFHARMESKADPDSTHPVWTGGECIATTRWKLANDAGEQSLDVVAGGTGTITQDRITIRAFSREAPRLTAGYGYFWSMKFEETVTCEEEPGLPKCEGQEPGFEVTQARRGARAAPYFALEMPLFFSTDPSNRLTRVLYQRTRLTLGTTFDRPEDNLFVGVTVFPLLFPASEASPFQVSGGITAGGLKSPYLGLSLDATSIISPVLKAVGIPGL